MAKAKNRLTDRIKSQPTEMTAEAQEKALNQLKSTTEKPKKKKVRVSVDFPADLYERMKVDTEANGQTHRGFIISLVREYYSK